jgi:hypothetical protein
VDHLRNLLLEAVRAKDYAADTGRIDDWTKAYRLFQEVQAIEPTAAVAYEIGIAATHMGRNDIAFEAYTFAVENDLQGGARVKAEGFLAEWRDRMAKLDVTCPDGSVLVVNEITRGTTPISRPLVVMSGAVRVNCIAEDGTGLYAVLTTAPGEAASVSLPTKPANSQNMRLDRNISLPLFDTRIKAASPSRQFAPVSAKSPAAPQRSTSDVSRLGWVLIGGGATVGLFGTYLALLSGAQLDEGRRALKDACAVQVGGPDSCKYTKRGQQSAAQSHADSIATWKSVRWGAWTTLATGAASIVTGIVALSVSNSGNAKSYWACPLTWGSDHVAIACHGMF